MDENGGLDRYSVLMLADVGPLGAKAVPRSEVRRRRRALVLTGRSAFDAEGRAQLAAMPATRIIERTTDPHALKSVYVTERAPEEGRHYFAPVSPVFGAHYRVEAKPDAQGRPLPAAGRLRAAREVLWPRGRRHARLLPRRDRRVALIPWTVGRSYHELGLTTFRDIVVDLVTELLGDDEPVPAELAEHVELTLQRRGDDLVVHLINLSGARRKNYGPHLRTGGGTLRLGGAGLAATATALVARADCRTTRDGDDLVFSLPELQRFEVVVIEKACHDARRPTQERATPVRAIKSVLATVPFKPDEIEQLRRAFAPADFIHCEPTTRQRSKRRCRPPMSASSPATSTIATSPRRTSNGCIATIPASPGPRGPTCSTRD